METIEELIVIYLISRNKKTLERGFINSLTNEYTGYMLYFLKFEVVKGCVCYIFASLFCMSRREHL